MYSFSRSKNIEKFYIIDPYKLDDDTREYDLYLEIVGYMLGKSIKRLRDVPTILTKRQKYKCWNKLIFTKRSYKSSNIIRGYLNAFKYKGCRTWYVVLYR
jgi:hypothetical protein